MINSVGLSTEGRIGSGGLSPNQPTAIEYKEVKSAPLMDINGAGVEVRISDSTTLLYQAQRAISPLSVAADSVQNGQEPAIASLGLRFDKRA